MYSEDALISRIRKRFFRPDDEVGLGDDAAVVAVPAGHSAVLCSDLLAENVHFKRDTHPPLSVGFKSVAVNVSDVAAMGGAARYFLVSLALPPQIDEEWIDRFFDGIEEASRRFDVSLVGGDVSSADTILVDVSMHGIVPTGKAVRRSGARPGDAIHVTGRLGGSELGLAHILGGGGAGSDEAVTRHLYPNPPFRVGPRLAGRASAMTDISDGLSTDLGHILAESRVRARLDAARIPRFEGASLDLALHGGEEYELIVVGRGLPDEIEGIRLFRIGEILEGGKPGEMVLQEDDAESLLEPRGWRHFHPAR